MTTFPLLVLIAAGSLGIPTGGTLLVLLVLVLISGFFSGCETALISAHRIRLEALAAAGRRDARTAVRLLDHGTRTIATTLVGTNLATVGASSLATALFAGIVPEHGAALATICMTPILLFAGEIIPKALFRSHAVTLLRLCAPALSLADFLLRPLVRMASSVTSVVLRLLRVPATERPQFRREDLAQVFLHAAVAEREGSSPGVDSTLRMARRTLELKDRPVSDAMVPLPEEWTVPTSLTLGEAVGRLRAVRSPFLAALDEAGRVRGFVPAKSLLDLDPGRSLGELVHSLYVLNPDDPLDDVVGEFRRSRQSVALVRDRAGNTLGIVTVEDLLEEIVGELLEELVGELEDDPGRAREGDSSATGERGPRHRSDSD